MTEKRLKPLIPFRLFYQIKDANKRDCELCCEENAEGGETRTGNCYCDRFNVHCSKSPFRQVWRSLCGIR